MDLNRKIKVSHPGEMGIITTPWTSKTGTFKGIISVSKISETETTGRDISAVLADQVQLYCMPRSSKLMPNFMWVKPMGSEGHWMGDVWSNVVDSSPISMNYPPSVMGPNSEAQGIPTYVVLTEETADTIVKALEAAKAVQTYAQQNAQLHREMGELREQLALTQERGHTDVEAYASANEQLQQEVHEMKDALVIGEEKQSEMASKIQILESVVEKLNLGKEETEDKSVNSEVDVDDPEDGVTHARFFGENFRRVLSILRK